MMLIQIASGSNINIQIHSNHSYSDRSALDEMRLAAVEKGLGVVCFTKYIEVETDEYR